MTPPKLALVTGAAKRLGKAIAQHLHAQGFDLILHYQTSDADAQALSQSLDQQRPGSTTLVRADLANKRDVEQLVKQLTETNRGLDVLINNASAFVPDDSNVLAESNLKVNALAPERLANGLKALLKKQSGCIINMVDIYADRPLRGHTAYCASKAYNAMLVKSLALELAPHIRVNGIAPGAILWPEEQNDLNTEHYQRELLSRIPLKRLGDTRAITQTVQYILDCSYLTGQIINVDGGRSITI